MAESATLSYLINVHVRLFILRKQFALYKLIQASDEGRGEAPARGAELV